MFRNFLVILVILYNSSLYSQNIPPIQKYSPQETSSGNQNWMITQGENENIYIANNKGLLEFNGSKWVLYPSPNGAIFRSVKSVEDKIYTGAYMDFGYWISKDNGVLVYESLVEELKIDLIENEQFWNIMKFNELVIFQSLERLIIIDAEQKVVTNINPKETLLKAFKSGGQLYFQEDNKGLFVIEKGRPKLVTDDPAFKDQIILNVIEIKDKKIAITNKSKFYDLTEPKNIKEWLPPANKKLSSFSTFSALELSNGNFALGTIANGYFELNKQGEIVQSLNQKRGLSNNTVLSIFEDVQKNTWLALDNGINYINTTSPFYEYKESWDELGTVYVSKSHDGFDYLGTNHGLYVKKITENSYSKISGTEGQVWNLQLLRKNLFCGHDKGTFLIEGTTARKISSIRGTWIFKEHPTKKEIIFQGNYNGIHVLQKIENQWAYKNKLEGFDISSRFFEFVNDSLVLVGHEYKGVFGLEIEKNTERVKRQYKESSVEKGKNAALISFDKEIFYYNKKGVFRYKEDENKFMEDRIISALLNKEEYSTGKMNVDETGRLWFLTKNKAHYFNKDMFTNKLVHRSFYLGEKNRKSVSGFEHVGSINQNSNLIGTNNGFVAINLNEFKPLTPKIKIDAIICKNGTKKSLNKKLSLEFKNNDITFEYSANAYQKYYPVEYQYKLSGGEEQWSSWSKQPSVKFENLAFGTYVFEVRSKIGKEISEIKKTKTITILAPWYWSAWANVFYVLSFFVFILIIRGYYSRKNRKEQLKIIKNNNRKAALIDLENQKELIRIRNEQLQKDVASKNRELAVATMGTLKRNEFLNLIKKDLSEIEDVPKVSQLIKKINQNLNNNDDWEYFEKAFNNADKDFFKKIKNTHPKLTHNDLKLCAYLRLNLSSKEIAPLLNISVHSVEIKRYRLRKKMNLSREQRIVEYIMTF